MVRETPDQSIAAPYALRWERRSELGVHPASALPRPVP
jgi:hypothetical protein